MPASINVNVYNGQTGTLISSTPVTINNFTIDIVQNLQNHLTSIENFIAANPTGAVLTAAQTLFVAQTLAGLIRLTLAQVNVIGQAN